MPDDQWAKVGALIEEALARPPGEREAFLRESCEEAALREEVVSLLERAEESADYFDRLAGAVPSAVQELQEGTVTAEEGAGPAAAEGDPLGLEGTAVGGYAVEEYLGGGGMGVVYRARDTQLGRPVALKFLPPHLATHPEAEERFVREAKAAAALDHPNIGYVHEIGEADEGQLFIAMAYYDGETLKEKLAREGPFSIEDAMDYATQIAEGLARAHEAGIVHRDIKPANVMVTEAGTVKIVDFGLARAAGRSRLTDPGRRVGTAAYMSPEQAEGKEVAPPADLWALGVVLYEMLTGARPFEGERETAVLHAILHGEPVPLGERRAEVPATLEAVVERCMRKAPEQRYAAAADLIEDLEAVQASAAAPAVQRSATAKPTPGHLPAPLTSFVGREREVKDVKEQLASSRLLTLTGPAGTGKTRLALQGASAMKAEMNGGVFFVPLAPVTDPDLVASAIAQALGVDEKPTQPIAESVKEALQDQEVLLVLDNFEQVISAAPVVAELLAACPALRVLVTSREALRLSGEQEFPVPPLEVPPSDASPDPDDLLQYSAVALFVERATAVRPHFALTEANARPVAELCRRLEGLPLAIELAAARIKLFSPQEMLERLSRRLDLLKGGPRDRPARHQTLRQAIAWSYDLLDEKEQAFFRRMAVFVDGCTVEAAEAVTNACDPLDLDVVDGVAALVDRNLLRREEGPDGTSRFVMLESIRAYGLERLQAEGEAAATRRAHADYFLSLAETAEPNLTGPKQGHWLDRLEAEHDNLRAALSWAEEQGAAELGLRMGAALWRFWAVRGHLREGSQRLERLLDHPEAQTRTPARARALNAAGTLLHETSDFDEARARLEESLSIWRETKNKQEMATVLNNLGWVALMTGNHDRAQARSEEALSLCRALGAKRGVALSLNNLGHLAMRRGAFDTARSLHQESLDLRRDLEDERGTAFALTNLGFVERYRGSYERATDHLEEALTILQKLNDKQLIAWTYNVQALVAHGQGTLEHAAATASDSVSLWREVGNKEGLAFALCTVADIQRDRGDLESARKCVEEAVPMIRDTDLRWHLAWALRIQGAIAHEESDGARAMTLYKKSLGILAALGAKWGVIQCLEAIAHAIRAGDPGRAVRLQAAAEALRERFPAPRPPVDQDDHERHVAMLRAELGADAFQEAWDEGRAMALNEAIALARGETD